MLFHAWYSKQVAHEFGAAIYKRIDSNELVLVTEVSDKCVPRGGVGDLFYLGTVGEFVEGNKKDDTFDPPEYNDYPDEDEGPNPFDY